jgi:signal transduction histidine kinase
VLRIGKPDLTEVIAVAEITAGLPLAASFAFAGGLSLLRQGRRRAALNEAVHELRRPLQALSLAAPRGDACFGSSLQLTVAALERLDREINGGLRETRVEPVPLRPLVLAAVARWRQRAEHSGGNLELRWSGGPALVPGDPFELAQALDNLIINGIEHGVGRVLIAVRSDGSRLRLVVRDFASRAAANRACGGGPRALLERLAGRNRRGHGLRVVRRVAASSGGSFHLLRQQEGSEAILEWPDHSEADR